MNPSAAPSADTFQLAANTLRFLAMDAVEKANSGHPGMPMGMADIATVLWSRYLRYNPRHPDWLNRDRFILSNGHGSMLLYGLLHLTGYDLPMGELERFRQLGSRTPGHPEAGHTPGVEVTTGPLGQGISNAVGMALAERWLASRFNRRGHEVIDHHTYVFCGDGDLEEGVSHEACSLAGHLKLGKLIVLYDDNHITIDGQTALSFSEDVPRRFAAYGWHTQRVDGHDPAALAAAIEKAQAAKRRPSLIACRTVIGWGAPTKAGKESTHGSPLGAEEIAGARKALGWSYPPFQVPPAAQAFWQAAGARGEVSEGDWNRCLDAYCKAFPQLGRELTRIIEGRPSTAWEPPMEALAAQWRAEPPEPIATRATSGKVLEAIAMAHPDLIGGSADLTPSNNTHVKAYTDIAPGKYAGKYLHYGVREHGMGAIMNGMARHGGVVPYAGTFLTFSDYMRGSVRLAALTGTQVIYVYTHDSIGLGEDGPTHQPVEHFAALRAMPNLRVFRPADARETLEAWAEALRHTAGPSALLLTRQKVPTLAGTGNGGVARGGYVLAEPPNGLPLRVLLLGTGSELHLAVQAQATLANEGIGARVVSLPCWELFAAQPADYQEQVLPSSVTVRVAVEAGVGLGWERWIGMKGAMIGMHGFGASAPAGELYKHYAVTAEHVAQAAKEQIG